LEQFIITECDGDCFLRFGCFSAHQSPLHIVIRFRARPCSAVQHRQRLIQQAFVQRLDEFFGRIGQIAIGGGNGTQAFQSRMCQLCRGHTGYLQLRGQKAGIQYLTAHIHSELQGVQGHGQWL
jgi:hypothetical protein